MKTLIIHPKDSTTAFLKPIYAPIFNKTIINGGVSKNELRKLIKWHQRVIMLGHGTPWGLMAVNQFPGAGAYIVDNSFSEILSTKKDTIYIWCNADQFVRRNELEGFYTGMFISEPSEAMMYNNLDWEKGKIDESNDKFSEIVSQWINDPLDALYENVLHEYAHLANTNPIARFNLDRLYYNSTCVGKFF